MISQQTLFYTILATLLIISGGVIIWLLLGQSPDDNNALYGMYAAIAGFSGSLAALIMFWVRQFFTQRELVKQHFWSSIRQGLWVAILLDVCLFLNTVNLFTWYNSAFLIVALISLEIYFLYNERKNSTN